MAYHTSLYLFIFLPAVLLAYQLTPGRWRPYTLLLSGYTFFWIISRKLLIYLLAATLITHYTGILLAYLDTVYQTKTDGAADALARKKYTASRKLVLAGGVSLLLCILLCLKYSRFFAENLNLLLQSAGLPILQKPGNLLLPIGISYYTLQAVSYMADVFWKKHPAQKHPGKVALYLCFFPQIMEGPICSFRDTADALWAGHPLKSENLSAGGIRIFWGLFKKMIIADRLHIFVQSVFDHHENYSGMIVVVAAVAYTLQLFMEFSGCMDIIIGSGRMLNVTLPENFSRPFLSRSAAEFWRRWHITLGIWLKTYVFYPISASSLVRAWSRFGKKYLGSYLTKAGISVLTLFPVWICNGIWHGPRWNYIFYGMYYFVILLSEILTEPFWNRLARAWNINTQTWYWNSIRILKTWCIIFIGELFFRANSLKAGFHMFFSMFRGFDIKNLWDGSLLKLGMDMADWLVVLAGCMIVALAGILKERNLLSNTHIQKLWLPVRWGIYYGLIFAVMIFGAYGTGYQQVDLIYAGF